MRDPRDGRDDFDDLEEEDWMPKGSRWRVAGILAYAVGFCLVFLGWPVALAIWLSIGAQEWVKAVAWGAVATYFLFHQELLARFLWPFGPLSWWRWRAAWLLHRDHGTTTMEQALEAARNEIVRRRQEAVQQAAKKAARAERLKMFMNPPPVVRDHSDAGVTSAGREKPGDRG